MRNPKWKVALATLCLALPIFTAKAKAEVPLKAPTPACVVQAVNAHKLPLSIILALIKTEGGHPGTIHQNSDKYRTHDLGVMQINDRTWIPEIANRDWHGDRRAAIEAIKNDGCYNVMWGTEIFSRYVDETNGRYWLAVGYYNSHNDDPRIRYTKTVVRRFLEVLAVLKRYGVIDNKSTAMQVAQR